jgi:hypothetical protein
VLIGSGGVGPGGVGPGAGPGGVGLSPLPDNVTARITATIKTTKTPTIFHLFCLTFSPQPPSSPELV